MKDNAAFIMAMILLAGLSCQWLAWILKLPAILFLLVTGILAGPVLNWVDPDLTFGPLLMPFISLAVAVILFEGSLSLKLHHIKGLENVIRNMITIGALITWILTTFVTYWLLDFSWQVSFLFAALMVVTGPTVIIPLLRTVHLKENIANILRWEGILIDPIGAVLAVLVYGFIIAGDVRGGFIAGLLTFGKIILIGTTIGILSASLFTLCIKKCWVPQYLHNFTALTLVCTAFSVSNFVEGETGLLTVTVMGVWLANRNITELDDILNFKESLSLLLTSVLFILLAARMDISAILSLGWVSLALLAIIQFIIRPLSVHISSIGSRLNFAERNLIAWIGPKGIIAAAISTLFSLKLEMLGFSDAAKMVPLTFLVIIGTVLVQSLSARKLARLLHVAEEEPKGFLIVGANNLALAIGKQLIENGFRVCIADNDRTAINAAKMKNLPTYWGNPVSKHAERHLDLIGIGHLLIITPHLEMNAHTAAHYRLEFPAKTIYAIETNKALNRQKHNRTEFKHEGEKLFNNIAYQELLSLISHGGKITTTLLTETFSYQDYIHQKTRIPFFAIDPQDHIYIFTHSNTFTPKAGWRIIGLVKSPIRRF